MKRKLSHREIIAFLLGILVMLLIVVFSDWESFRTGFIGGINNL